MRALQILKQYAYPLIVTNIIHLAFTLGSAWLLPAFSFQSHLYPDLQFVQPFANFDGIHYLTNHYQYEPNFAFLPLYTTIVQFFRFYFPSPILWLILINKIVFVLSVVDLFKICQNMGLSNHSRNRAISMYIMNPAGVFFHSVYTESIYAFLTFKSIRMSLQSKEIKAIVLLSVSTLFRSTAIFLLPVLGLNVLGQFLMALNRKQIGLSIQQFMKGIIMLIVVLFPFAWYLNWSRERVCGSERAIAECQQRFLNIYSYVQAKHWNVGLLTYYKPQNVVFILLGFPSIIVSIFCLVKSSMKWQKLGLTLSFIILLAITILYTNIQSSTRFLCSHPFFYVLLAEGRQRKLIRFWQLGYFCCGMLLFAVGFPWT